MAKRIAGKKPFNSFWCCLRFISVICYAFLLVFVYCLVKKTKSLPSIVFSCGTFFCRVLKPLILSVRHTWMRQKTECLQYVLKEKHGLSIICNA